MRRLHMALAGALLAIGILTACTQQGEARFAPRNDRTASVATSSTATSASIGALSSRPRVHLAPGALSSLGPPPIPLFAPPADLKIPVLVYHHVRPQQGWSKSTWSWKMTVSPAIFEEQMAWIAEHGYTSVDLDTAVAMLKNKTPGPLKPIVITFDDNQLNAYENGAPVMERYGLHGVWYLITNRLDQEGVVNRARALDLLARGHSIQSHTVTHAGMTWIPLDQIDWQLRESKRVLEELTGQPVLHIAYPLTAHNATVRERTKAAGYVTGSVMDPRFATKDSDLFKLPRIMMTDDTDLQKVLP